MSFSTGVVKVLRRGILTRFLSQGYTATREKSSMWYPDYLDEAKSKFPEYTKTNIQIKGFDYVILESYQRKIHWIINRLGLDVTDAWPQECKKLKVVRFKTKSENPDAEYILKRYERNIQVSDVYSYQMGTLIDLITSVCPPGVTVRFHPHEQIHEEIRYVPELKILELKQQLKDFESGK